MRSDRAVDDVAWSYYEQLLFLMNSVEGISSLSNGNALGEHPEEALLGEAPYGYIDCVSALSVESNQGSQPAVFPSTDSQAIVSDLSDQEIATAEAAYEELSPAPLRRQRKRKREDEDLQQQLDEVSTLLEKHKPLDEHEHIAMSLTSHMSAVKPENVLEMRVKLLQVIQMFKEKCVDCLQRQPEKVCQQRGAPFCCCHLGYYEDVYGRWHKSQVPFVV